MEMFVANPAYIDCDIVIETNGPFWCDLCRVWFDSASGETLPHPK